MYKKVMTGPKPEGLVGEREHDRLDEPAVAASPPCVT